MSTDRPAAPDWPDGFGLIWLDEVDSTMNEAARRAPGLSQPTWIAARMQTAARGRLGRVWRQDPANFAASLVQPVDEPAQMAGWRSFLAAVALADTLEGLGVARDRVRTKWPNDVLLDGGKLAGILLESQLSGEQARRITTGIGVNLATAPPPDARAAFAPVALSAATGLTLSPEAFLPALATSMAGWDHRFRTEGPGPLRQAWTARSAHQGTMTIRTGSEDVTGQFTDLDELGRLVLRTDRGIRHFSAGDISFRV